MPFQYQSNLDHQDYQEALAVETSYDQDSSDSDGYEKQHSYGLFQKIILYFLLVIMVIISFMQIQTITTLFLESRSENAKEQLQSIQLLLEESINPLTIKADNGIGMRIDDSMQGLKDLQEQIQENGGRSHQKFIVPSYCWTFVQKEDQNLYLVDRIIQKNKEMALKSGFQFNIINTLNYKIFIHDQALQNLIEKYIIKIKDSKLDKKLKQIYSRQLIILGILIGKGGIYVDSNMILLQNFSWLQDINNNIFINREKHDSQPKIMFFYSPPKSSPLQNNNIDSKMQVKKVSRMFPAIQQAFIAAKPNEQYLKDIFNEFIDLLSKPQAIPRKAEYLYIQTRAYNYLHTDKEDIQQNLLIISSQLVLTNKQKELNKYMQKQYALDYYGIKAINMYYFPYKLVYMFNDDQYQKIYALLSKITLSELQTITGPFKYMIRIPEIKQMNRLINQTRNNVKPFTIIKQSFLDHFLFKTQTFVSENIEKTIISHSKKMWSALPRIIWIFWDKGLQNSHASNQILVENMREMSKKSGFKLIEVNNRNLHEYIDSKQLNKIQQTLINSKVTVYDQTFSDLVRLALLFKHGGIYMDASFVLYQNLDWLINIADYPSNYIFNRYGELPEIFMFFHPYYASPFGQWQVDPLYNTKAHWHFAYENNFIATLPNNILIQQWFDLFIIFLSQPYRQTQKQFVQCEISKHQWTVSNFTYLLAMDTLKCVIGRKEKQLMDKAKNIVSPASYFYKIWSMNGYNGVQKFRNHTNFQNSAVEDNIFFYRYSQFYVNSIIGKPRHLTKFYNHNNINFNSLLKRISTKDPKSQIHAKSYCNKHLSLLSKGYKFINNNDNFLLMPEQ